MEPTVMTTPLGAARVVTKIPAQDLDRARLRAAIFFFDSEGNLLELAQATR